MRGAEVDEQRFRQGRPAQARMVHAGDGQGDHPDGRVRHGHQERPWEHVRPVRGPGRPEAPLGDHEEDQRRQDRVGENEDRAQPGGIAADRRGEEGCGVRADGGPATGNGNSPG